VKRQIVDMAMNASTTVVSRCLCSHDPNECLPTLIMGILGDGLMPATPVRPAENMTSGLRHCEDSPSPQPTPLIVLARDGQDISLRPGFRPPPQPAIIPVYEVARHPRLGEASRERAGP
jgi:hypothetical protein